MDKHIYLGNVPKARFIDGDTDEITNTLAELREWVERAIQEDDEGNERGVSYEITRAATPEEVAAELGRKAKSEQRWKELRRTEYEKLKEEFEGTLPAEDNSHG